MKIKIISNGDTWNTKAINIDTGEEIEGITSINWVIDIKENRLAKVKMELIKIPVEVEGETEDGKEN